MPETSVRADIRKDHSQISNLFDNHKIFNNERSYIETLERYNSYLKTNYSAESMESGLGIVD